MQASCAIRSAHVQALPSNLTADHAGKIKSTCFGGHPRIRGAAGAPTIRKEP
jgi:hypothetical protein